ncbi:nose resistant to fluoxetine protein 6-like [Sitodiplosis mosellana]|uniref:nose resistant to fluoxetine protein 6-like n=1 Tax=Sitodiplosis mosellana TaxID=263140 RepID=UPI002444DEA0|nr:nose resistant to fluoxetine protein 6-like [Sitodiplosis mosellana]
MLRLLLSFLAVHLSNQYVGAYLFNMTEYLRMPVMSRMDDYDKCFLDIKPGTKATYCMITSLIKPNESSEIWQIVSKYSSDRKRMYRHDRLTRGICMDWCKKQMNYFDYDTRKTYYIDNFYNDTDIYKDPNFHTRALVDRARYYQYATECVNYELKKQYGLMAQSQIRYCITNKDTVQTTNDTLDVFFVVLCIVLALLVVLSTSYDFHLKRNNLPHLCNREHYKRSVDGNAMTLLLCFSLPRNWYKLTTETQNSELSRDLRAINAFRTFCMFGVICAHCALANNMCPQLNPYYIEQKYFVTSHMIIINGANALQSFFAITGFLIAIQFMDLREKHKFKFSFFWKAISYRYLRYTPVYSFILLFNATFLYKLREGPSWPILADTERLACRNNWWTNMLYINNFVNGNEPCMQHAWYLATDYQLVIFGTLVQMIIWKFTKWTKPIFAFVFAISFLIPAVITYIYRFEGTFMAAPETTRYAHWYDEQYHTIYIPFYTNMGSSVLGMIAGLLYCKHKQGHIDLTKSKVLPILWYSLLPIAFMGLWSGHIFYANEFEKPAIWIAIYAACMKSLWGVFGATLVLGSALNTGWVFKNILRMQAFRTMGRLTFGAYLIHPSVIRLSYGSMRHPFFADDFKVYDSTVSAFVTSYALSFFVCMLIEMPFSIIQKLLFNRNGDNRRTEKTIYETTETEAIKLSKKIAETEEKTIKSFS